jgi:hypothetical protein
VICVRKNNLTFHGIFCDRVTTRLCGSRPNDEISNTEETKETIL